ncbi:OmcA/MtrC family decaheme c-type cytochrome [Shewanella baltica]|uniref:OmcA/MtrC family decaheme c-type cytochrome n=1 Tax=Shewanella baltica TaxID=62322 RepID=UPI00014F8779|nr:OmcA/MtrC family decaheme c-type cytochrome [Shewanella baltica]ABS07726.1 decaheme cytochrome c [Shewanella baltica OS185]HCE52482.1 OmcA/MtrC family decaheme c-type cytochrome [Shewanella baltica]
MMKRFNFNAATKAMLGAGLLSLLLAGCGGSDGKDGEDGKPGVVGVNIDTTPTLKASFTNATIDAGKVTVDFTLENANGVAVLGLNKDHDIRFGIAQLSHVTVATEDPAKPADRGYQWQAYINAKKEPGTVPSGVDNLNPSAQYQANVEAAAKCDTCLVDHGDGNYSYTYQANIANVTEPLAITYSAEATQRATLELELPQLAANAHFDWQPSTGKTEGIQTRNVVSITACYTCHQPESLELHGGRRVDIENCASCHTATSGDPESGNSIEFTYMIHAIHKGGERHTFDETGAEVPAPYKIVGYGGKVIDYGKVGFPLKPAADCAACHVEGAGAPANADLFKADLSNQACIGCHTEKPSAHHNSSDCVACHNATEPYNGTGSAAKRHGDVLKAYTETKAMGIKFTNVGVNDTGKITFDVQVVDKDGNAIDKAFVNQSSRVVVAWDSDKDYPSYADASYSNRRIALSEGTYNEANKTYSLTGTKFSLPADANGKTFELWSTLEVCFNNGGYGIADVAMTDCSADSVSKVAVKQAPYHFVWKDTGVDNTAKAATRRDIIDATKCQGCHNQEIHHYDNGVNCQTCHTSDKTLKSDANYPGGKIPTSFAWKAHEREGHYLKYAGVQSGTVLKTDCATCHTVDKANVITGIALGRQPNRTWRYGDINNNGADIWVSSDAGACLSCHQKYLTDATKSHIETNGGILNGSSAADVQTRASESCATCHTPAQLSKVHGN